MTETAVQGLWKNFGTPTPPRFEPRSAPFPTSRGGNKAVIGVIAVITPITLITALHFQSGAVSIAYLRNTAFTSFARSAQNPAMLPRGARHNHTPAPVSRASGFSTRPTS